MSDTQLQAAEALLRRAVVALHDYRDDLLLVGGLVPWLYRRLPGVRLPEHPALATAEADLSIRRPLHALGRPLIAEQLVAAGFCIFDVPGIDVRHRGQQRFQDATFGADKAAPVFLEFLSPLRGKPVHGLVAPQPGLITPALRYLDLLAHQAIEVNLATSADDKLTVRVPHPAMFIAQKILSRTSGRAPTKQPKDMAYVYDVALMTQPLWRDYPAVFAAARAASDEWDAWLTRAGNELDALFGDEHADGCVEALSVFPNHASPSTPSPRGIARVVSAFRAEAWHARLTK
jgi:hypothetical protein